MSKSKIDIVIEWLLNDLQLINQDVRQKLENELIGKLRYYKDSNETTIRVKVDGIKEEERLENIFYKGIYELDQKLNDLREILKVILEKVK